MNQINRLYLLFLIMLGSIFLSCNNMKREFYPDGQVKSEIPYKNSYRNGEANYYYVNGSKQIMCTYENDRLNGLFKTWYFNGEPERVENYVNDTLHGSALKYFENGKLQMELNYNMGKLNGKYVEYHENGQLKLEGSFLDDFYEGDWAYYNSSGILIGNGKYSKGNGVHVSFHLNTSDTLVKTPYARNEKHGDEVWFNEDGSVREVVSWNQGVFSGRQKMSE